MAMNGRTLHMTTTKLLFTPGPLTTSDTVKSALLRDAGSRDAEFLAIVRSIRDRLLRIGGAEPGGDYECVLMQGSGTFAIESVISSAVLLIFEFLLARDESHHAACGMSMFTVALEAAIRA